MKSKLKNKKETMTSKFEKAILINEYKRAETEEKGEKNNKKIDVGLFSSCGGFIE